LGFSAALKVSTGNFDDLSPSFVAGTSPLVDPILVSVDEVNGKTVLTYTATLPSGLTSNQSVSLSEITLRNSASVIDIDFANPDYTDTRYGGNASFATQFSLNTDASVASKYIVDTIAPTISNVPGSAETITRVNGSVTKSLAELVIANPGGALFDSLNLSLVASNGSINGLTDANPNVNGIQITSTALRMTDMLDSVSFVATNAGPASVALTVSDLAGNSQMVTYNFNVV
jgi:hypothetical protein